MSNFVLVAGQLLSVLVIVGGLAAAFWQIWVLAGKLARLRAEPIASREPAVGSGAERHEHPSLHASITVRNDRWSGRAGS